MLRRFGNWLFRRLFRGDVAPEMDGSHGADGKAVQAADATRVVEIAMVDVDTTCITRFDATAAFDALFRNGEFENAESRDDAERRSNRAYGVAEEAFAPKRDTDDDDDGQDGANAVG